MVERDRRRLYEPKNISLKDILDFAFSSAGTQKNQLVKKAELVINEMIKVRGKMKLAEFAKKTGYDYSNSQQKFWFKNNFFAPLFNAGLICEEFDKDKGEVTHIKLDSSFGKLMENFRDRWNHLAYRYLKEEGIKK